MKPEEIMARYRQGTDNPEDAFRFLKNAREIAPWNTNMRDAEHALYTDHIVQENPRMGPIGAAMTVPLYTGVKAAVQSLPLGMQYLFDQVSPYPMAEYTATPASWSEIKYGLMPLFGGDKPKRAGY
jgi:hypothetical protein